MGINGLLNKLKDFHETKSLNDFKGKRIGIDGYSWLHRACYGCAMALALNEHPKSYINNILHKISLLKHYNIIPLIVFDGKRVPLKADTNRKRNTLKEKNIIIGKKYYEKSIDRFKNKMEKQKYRKLAEKYFQQAITITDEMLFKLFNTLKEKNIQFIVAPYEADAQIVWLAKKGKIDAIITEDSDLLAYSMAADTDCPILYKLNSNDNYMQVISRQIIKKKLQEKKNQGNGFIQNLGHFFDYDDQDNDKRKACSRLFIQWCILSGCDFVESFPNIGIMKAQRLMIEHLEYDSSKRLEMIIEKIIQIQIKQNNKTKIPNGYLNTLRQAEALFFHHLIVNNTNNIHKYEPLIGYEETSFNDIKDLVFIKSNRLPYTLATFIGEEISNESDSWLSNENIIIKENHYIKNIKYPSNSHIYQSNSCMVMNRKMTKEKDKTGKISRKEKGIIENDSIHNNKYPQEKITNVFISLVENVKNKISLKKNTNDTLFNNINMDEITPNMNIPFNKIENSNKKNNLIHMIMYNNKQNHKIKSTKILDSTIDYNTFKPNNPSIVSNKRKIINNETQNKNNKKRIKTSTLNKSTSNKSILDYFTLHTTIQK